MIFSQFLVWSRMFPGRVGCWCCLVTVGRVVVAGVLSVGAPGAVFLGCSYSPLGAPLPSHHCGKRYIGETDREIKKRINEHLGYIRNKDLDKATGEHFNLPGHSESHLMFTIIEQSKSQEYEYRKEREKYFI